ncbi:hypothetical protein KIW84_024901 [Lathyrus oleraceus]|uniref:Uncharacterized protein n=1 Tax=Pisum sativum TaxID=3888 RepID=A0A9D5BD58_PEA|nr:hypothetical protein KIW84_024901 [Pisum sativum]
MQSSHSDEDSDFKERRRKIEQDADSSEQVHFEISPASIAILQAAEETTRKALKAQLFADFLAEMNPTSPSSKLVWVVFKDSSSNSHRSGGGLGEI